MKHKPVRYKGKFRKVFCNCNDSWTATKKLFDWRQEEIVWLDFESTTCPDCNKFPWIYISKADEPAPQDSQTS